MDFDFFLWPMLIPLILPLFYCFKYKKDTLLEVATITLALILIVIFYWPLLESNFLSTQTYTAVKILLFIILPLLCLYGVNRKEGIVFLNQFGITFKGVKTSIYYCVLFLPIMLGVTALLAYFYGGIVHVDMIGGIISFFEAFTEEFLFRGILFIFLSTRTNIKVAYIASLASFILGHPQHFGSIYLLGTIVQGIVTIEICRRSDNIIGAWLLHGINRFFILVLLGFLI
jgi:membrane protease YdiL (CAAX protease family)